MSWGIWVEDLETWLVESHTKDLNNNTWTANPSLWDKASDAKNEAKQLNTMWKGRKACYIPKKYTTKK